MKATIHLTHIFCKKAVVTVKLYIFFECFVKYSTVGNFKTGNFL